MTDEIQNGGQATTAAPMSADEQRAWDSPMLSRNAQPEGVPPAPPSDSPKLEAQSPEVTAPTAKPDAQSELRVKASNMDILSSFESDPQFKPIAQYLDTQLANVDTERAFGKALEYGNVKLIDIPYLREQLGERTDGIVDLAVSLFEGAAAKATAEVNSVYESFGGKEVVNQAIKFFNEKGDPQARKALGHLLDSGVKENIVYAMQQLTNFAKQGGGVAQRNALPLGQPSAERGLSKEEYMVAVRELTQKRAPSSAWDKLSEARKLGIQQGL